MVKDTLRDQLFIDISVNRLERQIQVLISSNTLIRDTNDRYKITEQCLLTFEKEAKEYENIEKNVKVKFEQQVQKFCPSLKLEQTWSSFNEKVLAPLIHDMGARTYELISGSTVDLDSNTNLQGILKRYLSNVHQNLREAIINFLDPKDPNIRTYILRQLNAYFFLEAGNLNERVVQSLSNIAKKKTSFTVFIDTNVLLSVLGLHDNPFNEATQSLLELINLISTRVNVKLYVSPITIDETNRVLAYHEQDLRGLRLTPKLMLATSNGSEFGGFAGKFAKECKKSNYALTSDEFFSPYINNLVSVIRSKGLELYNQRKIGDLKTDQKVIDDISDQLKFEEGHFNNKAKSYEQLEHDVTLWHFVRSLRPECIESPQGACYWIATVDYRFLGFDAFKRQRSDGIPICVHPTTLIQMLQFWAPRTQKLEETILRNLQLPFLFMQQFDAETEKVTVRILNTLARYENIDDLDQEAITSILVNEGLRQKLSAEKEVEKQTELIKEAIIEENRKINEKLTEEKLKSQNLADKISAKENELKNLRKDIEIQGEEKKNLEDRIKLLEQESNEGKVRQVKKSFLAKYIFFPSLLIVISMLLISHLPLKLPSLRTYIPPKAICCLFIISWLLVVDWIGFKDKVIREWKLFCLIHRIKKFLLFALITITLGVIVNTIFEAIKGGDFYTLVINYLKR